MELFSSTLHFRRSAWAARLALGLVRITVGALAARKKLSTGFDLVASRTLFVGVASITSAVSQAVSASGRQLKVANQIIQLVSIYVMHNLRRCQFTSKRLFHNEAMFKYSDAVAPYTSVSLSGDVPTFVFWRHWPTKGLVSALTGTKTLRGSYSSRFRQIRNSTLFAVSLLHGLAFLAVGGVKLSRLPGCITTLPAWQVTGVQIV